MSDLSTKPCPECGGRMLEIIRQDNPKERKGWHCMDGHFDKAVGRERIVYVRNKCKEK